MDLKAKKTDVTYNRPLYGIVGEFTFSPNNTVPFFSTAMEIERVVSELKTHEMTAPSLDQIYNLKELFQREIDIDRIEHDLVNNYLAVPSKLKFFNSLTIVLFPLDENGDRAVSFETYEGNDPVIPYQSDDSFDDNFKEIEKELIGGIQLSKTHANIGRIRWDLNRVEALAVDGQHRLQALRNWHESKNKALSKYEKETKIPVIFVLVDKKAGLKTNQEKTINNISRELFTDLNKNARKVDKATEIILDDYSVVSRSVRALVTENTCEDDPELLPLSFVRWRDEIHKFDEDYYLNSLVHLNLLIEDILNLYSTKDKVSKKEAKKVIKDINGKLSISNNELLDDKLTLTKYFNDNYVDPHDKDTDELLTPFGSLPPNFLKSAVDGFDKLYKPWILKLLTTFSPYKQLLAYARKEKLITGVFSQYHAQPRSHLKSVVKILESKYGTNWKTKIIDKHIDAITKIKGSGSDEKWAFKTIFQKAIVRIGLALEVNASVPDKKRLGTIADLIAFLDKLNEKNILNVRWPSSDRFNLWTFIALHETSHKIKVNKKVEGNIYYFLLLNYYVHRKCLSESKKLSFGTVENKTHLRLDETLRYFSQNKAVTDWPECQDAHRSLLKLFSENGTALHGKDKDAPNYKKLSENHAKKRLQSTTQQALKAIW
jgi:hypothetical protein